jgi:HK97 family phage prohead protease
MNRTNQTRTREARFQTRDENGERRIEGYFATFRGQYDICPGCVERVDPHAFDGALEDDIRCLIDHDSRLVLGRTKAGTLQLRVDEEGLWGSVLINPDDQDAMNLYARVQRGDVSQCSFGFDILEEDDEWNNETGEGTFTIKAVKLYEVSCVTFPAYPDTEITARRRDVQRHALDAWKKTMMRRVHK